MTSLLRANRDSFRAGLKAAFCTMGSWQRLLLLGGMSLRGGGGACAALRGRGVLVFRRQVRGAAGQGGGGRDRDARTAGTQVPWHCPLPNTL